MTDTALKTFHTASASQVKEFRDCNRKWWLNKMLGLPMPKTAALDYGEKVHKQLEDYANGKLEISAMMPEAVELIQFIPKRDVTKLVTEANLTLPKGNGWPVNVTGKIDLMGQRIPNPSIVDVIDWKTTSNFAYCPTEEEVKKDPQALVYLNMVFAFEPGVQLATFMFAYTLKRRDGGEAQSRTVKIIVPRTDPEFRQNTLDLKSDLHLMLAASTEKDESKVEGNFNSCDKYGGCPFRNRCHKGQPTTNGDYMGLFDQAPNATQTAIEQATAPAPVAPVAQNAAAFNPGPMNPPHVNNAPAAESPLLSQPVGQPAPVVAAPVTTTPAPVATAAAPEAGKRKRRTKEELRRDALITQCGGNHALLNDVERGELAFLLTKNPLPTNGGQPTAAAPVAAPQAQPQPVQVAQPAPAPMPAPGVQAAPPEYRVPNTPPVDTMTRAVIEAGHPAKRGVFLYINCRPNRAFADLSNLLMPLFKKIEADNKVTYWTQLEYGKGTDIAAGLLNSIMANPDEADRNFLKLHGDIFVDGRNPAFAKLIDVLKRYAVLVVEAA